MNGRPTQDRDAARLLRRLLEALSEPGARAAPSGLDDEMIAVQAPSKGVTVVRARLPAAVAEAALSEGLAEWERDGSARRLRLTEAGRAFLRRATSGPEMDPFRAQHGDFKKRPAEKGGRPTLVNEAESPLAWLARRKGVDGKPFLTPAQVEAGERFRRDVEQAQILQRVTANWEASIASSRRGSDAGVAVTEIAIDARKRLARAYEAVGPDLAGLLTDVCGYLKGLEIVESERGWPARSGKVVLKIALDRLARHYGVASEATGPARAKGVLHWGAEDYRPRI
ncbi:MAG: ATPase [Methylocystis sp.]|nr:MAG: ATPase [Methylocystis sp.]